MEVLKNWAVTLVTLIIFISMANIILPKNSIKNHVKFVLSLIVLAAMVIPITNFLSLENKIENYDLESVISKEASYASSENSESYSNEYMLSNLEKSIKNLLTDEYSGNSFDVKIKGDIDIGNATVDITSVSIEISSTNINKIQKVIIGDIDNNYSDESDVFKNEIKDFISKELGVDKGVIKINYV